MNSWQFHTPCCFPQFWQSNFCKLQRSFVSSKKSPLFPYRTAGRPEALLALLSVNPWTVLEVIFMNSDSWRINVLNVMTDSSFWFWKSSDGIELALFPVTCVVVWYKMIYPQLHNADRLPLNLSWRCPANPQTLLCLLHYPVVSAGTVQIFKVYRNLPTLASIFSFQAILCCFIRRAWMSQTFYYL